MPLAPKYRLKSVLSQQMGRRFAMLYGCMQGLSYVGKSGEIEGSDCVACAVVFFQTLLLLIIPAVVVGINAGCMPVVVVVAIYVQLRGMLCPSAA